MTAHEPEAKTVAAPLHRRILSDIREHILSGEWAPGHRIPFEHELSAAYGCSRMTVNKALSELARSGLIERRRRSGSFVAAPRSQTAVLEIHDIRTEVEALGLTYRHTITSRRISRAAGDLNQLGAAAQNGVLKLGCLHAAGARPFCMERRLISLAAVPEAAGEDFSVLAPGPWLLARVPWSQAEHRISAAGADAPDAAVLKIPEGSPCLLVERRTWSGALPVTLARFTYPGGQHTLVARFAPPPTGTA